MKALILSFFAMKPSRLLIRSLTRVACACLMAMPMVSFSETLGFNDNPAAKKYVLVLVGASADKESAQNKRKWAAALRETLQQYFAYDNEQMTVLLGADKKTQIGSDGVCDAQTIRNTFKQYTKLIQPGDQLTVFLMGHGSGEGELAKFHIVGPDLTAVQFSELFEPINTRNLVVINTTGGSYEFTRPLAKQGRILVSATRGRAEKYDTVFPQFLLEGMAGLAADRDKNGRLSVLEIFNYTTTRVTEYYRDQDRLASEHAALDDNGDGIFSISAGERGDGQLAEIAYLNNVAFSAAELSPQARAMRTRMNELERDIFLLRSAKTSLPEADYWQQLEPLIIELAKTTRDYHALIR